MKLGWRVFKDRRVSALTKLFAVALGALGTVLLIAFEVPLEGVLAALIPFVGMAADVLVDGAEILLVPMVLAALLLPSLAPKPIVESLRVA